jgi:hypothetical protein
VPTNSDPYPCDIDPTTGAPYPRTTHLQFFCDSSQTGYAKLFEVDQNSTDDCDYVLKFKTNIVCINPLGISTGWFVSIIMISSISGFVVLGLAYSYYKTRDLNNLSLPGVNYVYLFFDYAVEGAVFIANGFKARKGYGLVYPKGGSYSSTSASSGFTSSSSTSGIGPATVSSGSGYDLRPVSSSAPAFGEI